MSMDSFKTILAILALLFSLNHDVTFSQTRERIAVMPINNNLTNNDIAASAIENALIEVLTARKKFDLVERTELQRVLQEQELGQSGIIDENSAVRVGQLLGADYLILGGLTESGVFCHVVNGRRYFLGRVGASLKVVSCETGVVLGSVTEQSYSHDMLSAGFRMPSAELLEMAAQKLVKNHLSYRLWNMFPVEGYIIAVEWQREDKVGARIDLGSENGVLKGDRFIVFRRDESIQHPVTGRTILGRMQELGEAKVIRVDDYTATVEIKAKWGIQQGDFIRSKEKKRSFLQKVLLDR